MVVGVVVVVVVEVMAAQVVAAAAATTIVRHDFKIKVLFKINVIVAPVLP